MGIMFVYLLFQITVFFPKDQLRIFVHVPSIVGESKEEEERSFRNSDAPSQAPVMRLFWVLDKHLAFEVVDEHVVIDTSDDWQEVLIDTDGKLILPHGSILCCSQVAEQSSTVIVCAATRYNPVQKSWW